MSENESKRKDDEKDEESTRERYIKRSARADEHEDKDNPPHDRAQNLLLNQEEAGENDLYDEEYKKERDSTPDNEKEKDE